MNSTWFGRYQTLTTVLGLVLFVCVCAININDFIQDWPKYDWRTLIIPVGIIGLLSFALLIGKLAGHNRLVRVALSAGGAAILGFIWGTAEFGSEETMVNGLNSDVFNIIAGRPASGQLESAMGSAALLWLLALIGGVIWIIQGLVKGE